MRGVEPQQFVGVGEFPGRVRVRRLFGNVLLFLRKFGMLFHGAISSSGFLKMRGKSFAGTV
jgi:hypothetical protein